MWLSWPQGLAQCLLAKLDMMVGFSSVSLRRLLAGLSSSQPVGQKVSAPDWLPVKQPPSALCHIGLSAGEQKPTQDRRHQALRIERGVRLPDLFRYSPPRTQKVAVSGGGDVSQSGGNPNPAQVCWLFAAVRQVAF